MKKLKLYGEKKLFWVIPQKGFIADVFVDGKNNPIIESKYAEVKKDLSAAINDLVKSGKLLLRGGRIEKDVCITFGTKQKPGDPKFLEALKDDTDLWWDKKYGGFEISPLSSEIIEE